MQPILTVCRRFVEEQQVDVLTMEIEHVDVDSLDYVVLHQGVDVQPRPSTLRIIQVASPNWAELFGRGVVRPIFAHA